MASHLHYRLVVRSPTDDKRVLPLGNRPVRLGRSADCEIRTDEAMVSRLHCVFGLAGGRPTVTDQGSVNGTFVNGIRVYHAWLEHDDLVVVGRTTVRVRAVELPVTPPPEPAVASPSAELRRTAVPSRPRASTGSAARERLGLVYRLGALLASTVDEESAADAVLELVLEAVPVDRAFVLIVGTAGEPEVLASRRRSGEAGSGHLPSRHVVEQALETGRAIHVLDVAADPELAERASLAAASARAVLCAPLRHGERVLGLLYGDSTAAAGGFDEELALFEGIADQAALAIGRARLHDDLVREHAAVAEERDRLERARQSLEWRVREKTAIAEAQAAELAVRVEELEQVATARETLARGLVHDIKDLVGAVVAGLELLALDAPPGSKQAAGAEGALDAADRIVELAEDVLSVSRMESGAYQLDARRVGIEGLFEATARRLGGLAGRREVAIVVSSVDPEMTVTADPEVIGRVLDNLVGNGLRYAGPGGRVTLSATRAGRQVDLAVTDTGPGVPVEERDSLFLEWFRVGGASRGHHGLGLHFCRLAAEAHGGGIRVEGGPGSSRFVVSLPAITSSGDDESTLDDPPQTH